MMNCKQATRLLSDAQERPLSWSERLAVKLHISMCSGCRNFASQMPSLRQIARAYAKSTVGEAESASDNPPADTPSKPPSDTPS
tara:strand:+ start:161 stop:412 length:252 start_codon:yes stop_codon:yes gene_type:complete